MSDKLKFADVLAAQTSILIRLIRVGLDVRESNLDDRLLLDRIEDTITAYREADGGSIDLTGDPWSVNSHVIEFREDGWTIMHPLACRPDLFNCKVNRAAEKKLTGPPANLGRWRCELDSLGRFVIGEAVS